MTPAGARALRAVVGVCLAITGSIGCSPQAPGSTSEDSLTSGRIVVVAVPDAATLVQLERSAFEELYPDAQLEIRTGTSREAISALFAGECDVAVLGRELEPEERDAAIAGALRLEGYRFARDAIVMIVNPENPVENVTIDDLQRIYSGDLTNWSDMGGRRAAIVPVVQPPASDLTGFLVHEVLGGQSPSARSLVADSDSAMIVEVLGNRDALGYVSLVGAAGGARALRVAHVTGLSYWKPDAQTVYRGDYPLTRFYNLFVRQDGARLAHGFVTYVTSMDGQRIVREQGLVPTTVPVRFVRRSPMMSTHDEETNEKP